MREVGALYWNGTERKFISGWFHGFVADFEEFESGPGNTTVALVEGIETGKVRKCLPETVVFIRKPNGDLYEPT
jgi:hypothetical protein